MPIRRYIWSRTPDMSDAVIEAWFAGIKGELRYTADLIGFSFIVADRKDSDPLGLPNWPAIDFVSAPQDDFDVWDSLKLPATVAAKDAIHKATGIIITEVAVEDLK